jgi:hypothetical protein
MRALFHARRGAGMHEDERARWLPRARPAPRQARSADVGGEWRALTWKNLHGRPVLQITRRRCGSCWLRTNVSRRFGSVSTGSPPLLQCRFARATQQRLTCINASADDCISLRKNVRETPWQILLNSLRCRSTGPMMALCRASPSNAQARRPRSSAPRAIGRSLATPERSPWFGPVIPNIRRQCSDDLAPCPTRCDLRKDRPSCWPLAGEHTAGKVRGHASLMQPAKPSPGVPFVALPLYHGPNAHHDTIAVLSAEVESLNLPSAWLTNMIANLRRRSDAPPIRFPCQAGSPRGLWTRPVELCGISARFVGAPIALRGKVGWK